jgi:hypothetical protein
MASILLAMSTASFATSVSVSAAGDVSYDNTVSSGFNKSTAYTGRTIVWFQPYEFKGTVPNFGKYPSGGAISDPNIQIASAKLTIVAYGVGPAGVMGQPAQQDAVYVGAGSSGPWTSVKVNLTPGAAIFGQSDSTTSITLSDPNSLLKGTKGFWVRVTLQDGNQDDIVESARLQVTAHYTYTYTYVPKKIIFVSAQHPSFADANVPGDKGFVDLLRAAYYEVDYLPGPAVGTSYWETLDPNKLAALAAADLVIVGRDNNSAGLATDATEVAAWTNVKAPVMLFSSYIAANNRWKWINSSTQDARIPYYMVKAVDPKNPLFVGVKFDSVAVPADPNKPIDPKDPNSSKLVPGDTLQWYDPNVASGYASFIKTADAGSGKVLAVRPDAGTILIAEWFPGQPFYATSGQIPANHRMFFNAGTQEITNDKVNWGVMNLNAQGQKIFLNAVAYMVVPLPQPKPAPAAVADPNAVQAGTK